MYKSFILSITMTMLISVVYGAAACDKGVIPICKAFCSKALTENDYALCRKSAPFNICKLTGRNQTKAVASTCKDEIETACASFYEKVTKGACLCLDHVAPKCQVF